MRLLELTPDEIAFLAAPLPVPDDVSVRLSRKLALILSARLRLPLDVVAQPAPAPADAVAAPVWQPDAALATLWLTRRLGGREMAGSGAIVPGSLLRTLDAVLAECWLDAPAQNMPPHALAWRITTDFMQATLAARLPQTTTDMTRWAREIIRHG